MGFLKDLELKTKKKNLSDCLWISTEDVIHNSMPFRRKTLLDYKYYNSDVKHCNHIKFGSGATLSDSV